MKTSGVKLIAVFGLVSLVWGSTWLAIRASLESLSPLYSASFRFIFASIFILILMKLQGVKIQKDKISVKLYLLQGFFAFIIPFALIYWAEQYIPSGLAAVLFAAYPFFVALISYFAIPSEAIGPYKLIGIILGFTGIVIIFWDDLGGDLTKYLLGMIAVVFSAAMQAGAAVVIKKHGHHLNPLSMNLLPMLMGGVFLFISAFVTEDFSALVFDSNAVISVLYLALFGSVVTFTGYYWLMKRLNIVILSFIAFITPVLALLLGWIFMSETLSVLDLAGCLFVLAGLIIANLRGLKNIKKAEIIKDAA